MGKFNTHGGYFAPEGYFRINEGGSHEENPNGGVQVGVDQEGTPNMLEEGEPVYNDYVYSDNIYADGGVLEKYNIPAKYAGKLYSKIADAFVDEAEDRPNDPISNNGLNAMLIRLADAQEEQKAIAQQKELEEQLANMTPEELDALEAMLAEQEAAEDQAAQEQVTQEQAMAEQQATPEEQAMAAQQMQAPVQEVPQQPMMAEGGKLYANGGKTNTDWPEWLKYIISPGLGLATDFVNKVRQTDKERKAYWDFKNTPEGRKLREDYIRTRDSLRQDYINSGNYFEPALLSTPDHKIGSEAERKYYEYLSKQKQAEKQFREDYSNAFKNSNKYVSGGNLLVDPPDYVYNGGTLTPVTVTPNDVINYGTVDVPIMKQRGVRTQDAVNQDYLAELAEYNKRNPMGIWGESGADARKFMFENYPDVIQGWYDSLSDSQKKTVPMKALARDMQSKYVADAASGAMDKFGREYMPLITSGPMLAEGLVSAPISTLASVGGSYAGGYGGRKIDEAIGLENPYFELAGTLLGSIAGAKPSQKDFVGDLLAEDRQILAERNYKPGLTDAEIRSARAKQGWETRRAKAKAAEEAKAPDVKETNNTASEQPAKQNANTNNASTANNQVASDNTVQTQNKSNLKERSLRNRVGRTLWNPLFQYGRGYAVGRNAGWGKGRSILNAIGRGVPGMIPSNALYGGAALGLSKLYNGISNEIDYRNIKFDENRNNDVVYGTFDESKFANGGMLRNYFIEGGLIPGVHNIPSWYVLNKADGKYYDPEVLAREQAIAQSANTPAVTTVNRSRGTTGSSNTRNVGNIRSTRMQPIDASIMEGMAYKVNPNAAVVAPAPTGELSSITIQDTVPDYVTWRGIGEQFGMTPNWYRQGWVRGPEYGRDNYVMKENVSGISGNPIQNEPGFEVMPDALNVPVLNFNDDPIVKNTTVVETPVVNNTKPSAPTGMNQAAMNLLDSPYIQMSKTGDPITLGEMANIVANNNKQSAPGVTTARTNTSGTDTKQTTERPLYPTWMRYAGLANALGDMAWNLAQKPDRYHINPYRPVLPEGRMDLIDPIFNPLDENMAVNDLLASNAGTVYGLRNSGVGPSLGANLLAADYNAGRNMGAARTQIWDANNQRRNQIIAQRNQNAQALGQFRYGINKDRANYINQAALQNQHYGLLQQRLNNAAEQEKWDAFNTSKDALAKGFSNIGLENMRLNNANDLYDYVRLPDGRMAYVPKMNTAKCGGKMSKKTKK